MNLSLLNRSQCSRAAGIIAAGALFGTVLYTQQQIDADEEKAQKSGLNPEEFVAVITFHTTIYSHPHFFSSFL